MGQRPCQGFFIMRILVIEDEKVAALPKRD